MARLGLADQTELARWANSREAPGELPRLIRKLILETGRGVIQLGFPAGEGIATGSWDGTAQATEASAFVPAGLSLWELSVEKSVGAKAERDYFKRGMTPDGTPTEDCTYAAVSLRRWTKRVEWARAKSSNGRWKTVRAYGLDDLEAWLESAPVTHAWLSELLGLHPHGLLSAETWWSSWSGSTEPSFPAAAVLAGRGREVCTLQEKLSGSGQIITVQGASYDDILAVVSAQALTCADGGRLLSRMAFIDKVEAWRRLRDHSAPLVLVPRTQEVVDDLGAASPHHIIVPIVDGGMADITLEPIDSQEAENALVAAGFNKRLAEETGKIARLSVLAARRRIARKPELLRPAWAKAPVSRLLRRALLVGRWNERSAEDVSIVSDLFGAGYESMREDIASIMSTQDPLLARFGSSIGLVSQFDAWLLLRSYLRKDDLDLFQSAVITVFGEVNPALEPVPEGRRKATLLGRARAYSEDLRRGLATALALLGSHGEAVVAGSGLTGQDWASWTVRRILEAANQDEQCHLWASLRDVLSLLAEAAPTTFLNAVRDGLQGERPLLQRIFTDSPQSDPLFTDSPHSSLLWALEVCAWSPTEFGQTVDLLARLAEVDPGGRLGNRPAACLGSIFCPWYPQTSVGIERRLAALDGLRKRHGSIAWQLMVHMLPDHHGGTAMDMNAPFFRDWKPQKVVVTEKEYWDQVEEVCRRLLEDVGADSERCVSLIRKLSSLPPYLRVNALELLKALSSDKRLDDQDRFKVWESLREQVTRHRNFREAKWALPEDDVDRIEEVENEFQPSSPCKRFAWLFDEYMPSIPDVKRGSEDHGAMLARIRSEAVAKIVMSSTWPELHRFVIGTKLPGLFGATLVQANITTYESEMLDLLRSSNFADLQFASGYLLRRFQADGWPWVECHMREGNLSPEQSAKLLLSTDDFPRAWEAAEADSEETTKAFWSYFRTHGLGHEFAHAKTVAQQLLKMGRLGGALDVLALYMQQETDNEHADLMASCLEDLLQRNSEDPEVLGLRNIDLRGVFSYLERSDLFTERLARLEWSYLEIFNHRSGPPTLSRYIAQAPSFFVELISRLYRPRQEDVVESDKSEPEVEADKTQEAIARNAYHLLSRWRVLPGVRADGTVDGKILSHWVDEARRLLHAVHRVVVGDLHIGNVLASSPAAPDGLWPCIETRDLLETLQNAKVEDGLRIQLHNDRGATSRGMLDGGDQELELAAKYRSAAEQLADQWPRTAAVLRSLAQDYEYEARHYEGDAERRRTGFES
jgi:hypothetical protein